jgi:tetratricopeptide (TPR) repeat protein
MLRRAIALNSNYAPAYQWLAITLHQLGRREDALASLERAVALDPLSAAINSSLGGSREALGRFDDALVAYQQAIELAPTMPSSYRSIGDVHANGFGRFDTAVPWYEKAVAIDPGNPELRASLAYSHWQLGDDAEAGRWLLKLLANGEGTTFTNAVAALVYLSSGEETSARRHARKAAELDPGNMFLIRDDDLRKGDYATARARYVKAFPHLFAKELPVFNLRDLVAIELALVLQHTGEDERAKMLLDHSEAYLRTIPRLGTSGYGIADVAIHALRGDTSTALAKLREAERAGWRVSWRYIRDFDPNLASIRNESEFKAVFADIERDMARQRAELAARPKDAPLDLGSMR